MALTTKERKIIRDTLIEGGSPRKAVKQLAASRGRRFKTPGLDDFDWDTAAGEYDSSTAWDYATICQLYLKGKSVAEIENTATNRKFGEYT
jgi:hypothetical protein